MRLEIGFCFGEKSSIAVSNDLLAVLGPVGVQGASWEVNWRHGVRFAGFGAHFGLRLG